MNIWSVQGAKACFSELLDSCVKEGPQFISRRGTETAVLVPIAQWKRLNNAARPSLKSLLLSDHGRTDLVLPQRGSARRRPAAEE
jgi:prevent-host-death family protein